MMEKKENYLEEIPECPKLNKKEQDDILFLMGLHFKEYREEFIKKIFGENYKEIHLKDDLKKRGLEKWL